MLRRLFLSIAVSFLFASCATLLNGPTDSFVVHTAAPVKVVVAGDTLSGSVVPEAGRPVAMVRDADYIADVWRERGRFVHYTAEVTRDNSPLAVDITNSTGVWHLGHASRLDNKAWTNVVFYGITVIADILHPQGHFYPDVYFADGRYATFRQLKRAMRDGLYSRGNVLATVGLPWTNFFSTHPDVLGRRTNHEGFIGLSFGAEYFYADRRSVAAEVSGIIDFFLPVVGAVDFSGWHEFNDAINISLFHNLHKRNFSFGYGFNAASTRWRYWHYDLFLDEEELDKPGPWGDEEFTENRWKLGAVLNAYYKIGTHTSFGVVYRPTFYRCGSPKPWAYEHSISIDLKFYINPGRRVGWPVRQ